MEFNDEQLHIVEMSLSGNSVMDICGILDYEQYIVEYVLGLWDDLTDDEHDLYLARMNF
jgi:hypothetical protein